MFGWCSGHSKVPILIGVRAALRTIDKIRCLFQTTTTYRFAPQFRGERLKAPRTYLTRFFDSFPRNDCPFEEVYIEDVYHAQPGHFMMRVSIIVLFQHFWAFGIRIAVSMKWLTKIFEA